MTDATARLGSRRSRRPSGDTEPPPKRKRYWWRFTLAAVIIVAVSAGGDLDQHPALHQQHRPRALAQQRLGNRLHKYLSHVEGGEPEKILIIGSDKRART